MADLTPEAIAELRRLLVKSTPGPFGIVATCQASRGGRPDPSSDQYSLRTMIPTAISTSAGDLTSLPLDIGGGLGEADASFFAAVRNSADALLDAAERCAAAEAQAKAAGELLRGLLAACEAKDSLLACYRLGKQPSEALFKKLDKAKAAIEAAERAGVNL